MSCLNVRCCHNEWPKFEPGTTRMQIQPAQILFNHRVTLCVSVRVALRTLK